MNPKDEDQPMDDAHATDAQVALEHVRADSTSVPLLCHAMGALDRCVR